MPDTDNIPLFNARHFLTAALAAAGLFALSQSHFLVFHVTAELFSVMIACGIFMFALNSRRFADNDYFISLGAAYLVVAGIDTVHMLAYKGMGGFAGYDPDLATQLWVAARFLQAAALALAPLAINKKNRFGYLIVAFGLAAGFLLLSIFYWQNFPRCFVDGAGVTEFKTISEYFIIAVLGLALYATSRFRQAFSPDVLKLLLASIAATILSELSFSSYTNLYGIANILGHLLKIAAFYLVYKAIVETGIKRPYKILLRDLAESQERLSASEARFRDISYSTADWVWETDANGVYVFCSPQVKSVLGYSESEVLGKTPFDFMEAAEAVKIKSWFSALKASKQPIRELENWNITKDGKKICLLTNGVPILGANGNLLGYRGVDKDITLRRHIEQHVRWLASFPHRNPNPIIEVDLSGNIYYVNPVARRAFSDLQSRGVNHGFFADWRKLAAFFSDSEETTYKREVKIGARWFHQTLVYDKRAGRVRIYNVDITERRLFEELLAKKQEELQIIIDSIPAWVFYKDQNNRFIRVNKYFAETMGKSKEELEGKSLFELYPKNEAEAFWKDDKEVISSGSSKLGIIEPVSTKDGERLVETNKVPYRDARGDIIGVIGFSVDVTERNRAELAIRKNLQRFELLAQTAEELLKSPEPQKLVDSLCRKIMESLDCHVFFNFLADDRAGRLHLNACAGISAEQAAGIEWLDYGVAVCGCVARSGSRIVAERIQDSREQRTELVKSFGVRAYACHPLLGEGGKVLGTLSFGTRTRDVFSEEDLSLMKAIASQVSVAMARIHETKLLEDIRMEVASARLLQTERRRLYDVMETLPVYVILLTPDYHVTFANKFFRDRFGEDRGQRCFEYLFKRGRPCDNCQTYKVLENNSPQRWVWTGPDGRDYDIYDLPFKEADGSIHILEMGIDVTDRNLAQRALEQAHKDNEKARRLADIGALSATVAHELRNPLAAIKMAAHNIMRKANNPELDKHLLNIDRKIHESDRIINNLLFYSRIKPPHREKIKIVDLISECVGAAQERFPKHKAVIDNQVGAAADVIMDVDPLQLKEVFDNILNNAYDALSGDGGRIEISAQLIGYDTISVRVRDNGIGISQENLSRVLEPFFTTKAKGTGLGLAVCSQILQLHNGVLEISSRPNEGTEVAIRMPLASAPSGV